MSDRVYNTFNFTCKLSIPKETDKFKPYKKEKYDSGWIKEQLMITAKTDDSSVLLTLEGGYFDKKDHKITLMGKDNEKSDGTIVKGNKLEIPWSDRKKTAVIDKVADFAKVTFDLSSNGERGFLQRKIERLKDSSITEEETKELHEHFGTIDIQELESKLSELKTYRKEFLSYVDLIEYIQTELSKHTDTVFRVTGNIEFSEWNGKVYRRFIPKRIEKSNDSKMILKGMLDIFFNKNSLNDTIFEETKKYIINAKTKNYDGQLKKEIYIPTLLTLDASRLDLNNPKHKSKLDFLLDELKVEDDVIYELQYEVKFVSGAERKEITMDDLTDFQKKAIESGNKTFEQVKKELGGNKLGGNIDEIRLVNINLNNYPNGKKETQLTDEDFVIVRPEKEEEKNTQDNSVEIDTEDDTEDLL